MRKDNTENSRKKAVFTVIDVICIAVAILMLAVLIPNILDALPLTPTMSGDVSMTYVISVTDVPESLLTQIQRDQIIYDLQSGEMLGTISSIVHTPYVITGINSENGEQISNTVEGRYNLNITVNASAEEVDNDFRINGITMACGLSYQFRTSAVALNGTCISLKNQ